jgi:hypothetical protein
MASDTTHCFTHRSVVPTAAGFVNSDRRSFTGESPFSRYTLSGSDEICSDSRRIHAKYGMSDSAAAEFTVDSELPPAAHGRDVMARFATPSIRRALASHFGDLMNTP